MADEDDDTTRTGSSAKRGAKAAGKSLSAAGARQLGEIASQASDRSATPSPNSMPSYKRGGRVRKSGEALLHRGEKVRSGKRKKSRGGRSRSSGRY